MTLNQLPALLPGVLTLVAVAAAIVGFVALALGATALRRARLLAAHYEAVMTGVDGTNIAAALESYSLRLQAVEKHLPSLGSRSDDLDARLRQALQRVRLARFAAFEDAGGDQSFSLAMLNDGGDGVLLTGLYGRGGMRVYAKPVEGGRSTYALTTEEQRVLAEAWHEQQRD